MAKIPELTMADIRPSPPGFGAEFPTVAIAWKRGSLPLSQIVKEYTVTIAVTKPPVFRFRFWLGARIVRFGIRLMGFGQVVVNSA